MPTAFDVVVATGDVTDSAVDTLRRLRDMFPSPTPIVAVLGDREYRGADRRRTLAHAGWVARGLRIALLEDRAAVIEGVRYLGGTLWTDMRLHGDAPSAREAAASHFADLDIGCGGGARLDAARSTGIHWWSRTWLGLTLATRRDGPTVVVTHHAPTGDGHSTAPFLDPLAPCHASRCDDLVRHSGAALWVHGGPTTCDHAVGGTRVLARPATGMARHEVALLDLTATMAGGGPTTAPGHAVQRRSGPPCVPAPRRAPGIRATSHG